MRLCRRVLSSFRRCAARGGVVVVAIGLALVSSTSLAVTAEDAWQSLHSGDVAAALTAAEEALKEPDQSTDDWHLLKIECLLTKGDYADALTAAATALEHDSTSLRLQWASRAAALANGQVEPPPSCRRPLNN
jgi:hypothetical protein